MNRSRRVRIELLCEHRTIPARVEAACSRTSICKTLVSEPFSGGRRRADLGITKQTTERVHQLSNNFVVEIEQIVEVEHCSKSSALYVEGRGMNELCSGSKTSRRTRQLSESLRRPMNCRMSGPARSAGNGRHAAAMTTRVAVKRSSYYAKASVSSR